LCDYELGGGNMNRMEGTEVLSNLEYNNLYLYSGRVASLKKLKKKNWFVNIFDKLEDVFIVCDIISD